MQRFSARSNGLFSLLALLAACGAPTEEVETSTASPTIEAADWTGAKADGTTEVDVEKEPASEIMLFVAGGYDSCDPYGPYGMPLYHAFSTLYDRLQAKRPDLEIHYVVSCLTEQAPPYAASFFMTSDSAQLYTAPAQMMPQVAHHVAGDTMPIYLVGHGYGGWQHMYTALKLEDAGRRTAGLYTIDPISPATCDANDIDGSGFDFDADFDFDSDDGHYDDDDFEASFSFGFSFSAGSNSRGCRVPPPDVPWNLNAFTDRFLNFFQRNDRLASGPVHGAVNKPIYSAGHWSIQVSGDVWTDIESAIAADLENL